MKKLEVDMPCPKCHRRFRERLEAMHPGGRRSCPYCGVSIAFTGDDGRRVQRAVDDLERSLNDLTRRFRR